ncbi:MAG: hypothetical protein P8170_15915 [Gemmatimonadota bacterium]
MRFLSFVFALLLGALIQAGPAGAQQERAPLPVPVGVSAPAFSMDAIPQIGPTWRHRLLTAMGGAALGAGIGFFASQLARGDWDDGPGQPQIDRTSWAAVGGSVGLAAGFSFPLVGRGPPVEGRTIPPHLIITAEEMREIVAVDAYEAVEVLRPQWLVVRPRNVWSRLPDTELPVGGSISESLPVYLDDFRLGGIEELRGLSTQRIESIRFISAAMATAQWGIENDFGAIQVVTRGF